MRLTIVFWAVVLAACAEKVSYDGYKVYRLNLTNQKQLSVLTKLVDNSLIDFWSTLRLSSKPVDVMIHPKVDPMFTWILNSQGIHHEVLIKNVENVLKKEKLVQKQSPLPQKGRISFTQYNRFEQINNYLYQLQQDYPNIVTLQSIGSTYEGRDMMVIQISTDPDANKPVIFIDAGIHAREWIAPAMALYIINQLVENPNNSYLLDKVDWHILPVVNSDGYEYTFEHDRFWRKTRSFQQECFGTDANRNFGFHWGEGGTSSNPCDETFQGPYAFSEVEALNVKAYMESWKNRIKLYITFHSYGNYLLYPWGYTAELPDDEAELRSLAEKVNAAIVQAGGDEYEIGTTTNVLYIAAGTSKDWAKGALEIQLSYTIELPGGGSQGFDPSPSRIIPIVEETFPVALLSEINYTKRH
ncbi:hypothetical protein RN001_009869 [Aquatica leii]|uniref:Zinc carboxypeptidase A 1 n=1 Tax=Aquatica leii TaxID=1421715 RepID=A0AAN7SN20_9COLE|nr:hypothetical protein RN001_009869 [Aquatica leii]